MKSIALLLLSSLALLAQDPFRPLDLEHAKGVESRPNLRGDWVRTTNQRFELAGKAMRVAQAGPEGHTLVVTAPGIVKARHAKPILLGKDEHAALLKSALGLGFTRMVVRNPDGGEEWAARLEQGKAVLEF